MASTVKVHAVCPGCGCELSDYEVFACRIRGLKVPVCLGCLITAMVFLRDHLWPLLQDTRAWRG